MSPHPRAARSRIRVLPGVLLGWSLLAVMSCQQLEDLPSRLLDRRTPREKYLAGLAAAGLDGTALASDWLAAGERALREAPRVEATHREEGFLEPAEPVALAFRVSARRGQRLRMEVTLPGDTTTTVFLDAWQVISDSQPLLRVSVADSGARSLELDPRRDADYILRLQPELLRGGRFSVQIQVAPTLAFPVSGHRESDVGSRFGADRDGGARSHAGIDIFAPRGTAVLAASAGVVRRVEVTNLGGNVVWVTDDHGYSLYYAHLDTQVVTTGARVALGDTLGTVGNTGNARTTPPHLHFGVYRRGEGAVDPWWFVHRPSTTLPRLVADTLRLGEWIRTVAEGTSLRTEPGARSLERLALPRNTAARVVAAVGSWFRVRLPDGEVGYLPAASAESAEQSLGAAGEVRGAELLTAPGPVASSEAILVADLVPENLTLLGRFGEFLLVRTPAGLTGWISGD